MNFTYRQYLRSAHWQNLRLEKLAKTNAICHFCKTQSPSNDVHHVIYRASLKDAQLRDLRVLCRACHDLVHQVLKKFPAIKKEKKNAQWRICEQHVRRMRGEKISIPNDHPFVTPAEITLTSCRLKHARRSTGAWRRHTPLTEHLVHWFRYHLDCTDAEFIERAKRHAGKKATA